MPAPRRLASIVAVALLAISPGSTAAQTPGRAAPLLELPAGARAVGLGGAAQLGAADSDHLFQHPAYLGVGGFRATAWLVDASASALSLSTGTGAFGGRVALGVRAAEWTGAAPGESAGGLDGIVETGDNGRSTTALTVGYSRGIPFDLDLGVTATLLSDRVDASRARTVAVDVGLGTEIGPLALALTARNLGSDLEFGATDVPLPARYELAAGGYGQQLGPLDLGAAVRAGVRDDEEVVYGGGLELGYYPIQGRTFIARIGAQNVPEGDGATLTLGGSYRGDDLTIDYAWRDVDGLAVHTITLGWR
jgi:hypothetical protein